MFVFAGCIFYLVTLTHAQPQFVDISPYPDIFQSDTLPYGDEGNFLPRYMASVGNGHLSTSVYTDTVLVNGIYNGLKGNSHRARIPSQLNINITFSESEEVLSQNHSLFVKSGSFSSSWFITSGTVEQKTYAHRYYTRALITDIFVSHDPNLEPSSIVLTLNSNPGAPSEDIDFEDPKPVPEISGALMQCGKTKEVEDPAYQSDPTSVCVYWTEVPSVIELSAEKTSGHFVYVMVVDQNDTVAKKEFLDVMYLATNNSEELYASQEGAWKTLWDSGEIIVEKDLAMGKAIYGGLYYILSSLPSLDTNQPNNPFTGLSPGGLAYGILYRDYQGHSFWDTEMWMFPVIMMLWPELGKEIILYRMARIGAARDLARSTGFEGIRFPWESAFTGSEVTPDCCPEPMTYQVHITADVAFSVRQYISATRDIDWLTTKKDPYEVNGCNFIYQMAEFWASRAIFNESTGYYDIKGVMSPDEDHWNVDNSVYTNVVAGLALYFANYSSCLCGSDMEQVPEKWLEIARSLKLLFDSNNSYHPAYEGYEIGTEIKQADAILLGFPLMYKMEDAIRRNDLEIYEPVTRETGSAMTWSMHAIGFAELGDMERAEKLFNMGYKDYIREPFKLWTETKPPVLGALNFISGMGGFLQATLFGYGGLRLNLEDLKITFRVPSSIENISVKGLNYLGNSMDLGISNNGIYLTLTELNVNYPLELIVEDDVTAFDVPGDSILVSGSYVIIRTKTQTNCPIPEDIIGQQISRDL